MTDRSSEERSRFEKWFEAKYKGLGFAGPYFECNEHGGYKESTVFSEFETWRAGWVAALEDRQEAAPEDCARYKHALEVIGGCSKDGKSVNVAVLALHPPSVPSEATPNKKDEDWKKLKVGQWFFSDSPDCQDRYAVMERTIGGDSIVCSTPYHHKRAERDMKDIASLHNNADTKLDKAIAWVERCQKEYPENGHYLGMKVVLLGIKEGLR